LKGKEKQIANHKYEVRFVEKEGEKVTDDYNVIFLLNKKFQDKEAIIAQLIVLGMLRETDRPNIDYAREIDEPKKI
jgi:hypothetical protein